MSSRRRDEGRGRDKERCCGRNGDGDGINANGYTQIQVPITVPPALAWTDDLIKRRLVAKIKEFGAFGHAEIDFASQRSPTVERTMEAETNVDHDTNVDAENSNEIWHQYHDAERAIDQYQRGIQQQLRIMRGLMHKLGARRHSGVNSDVGGHSSYAPANTPTTDDHAFLGDEYMASHVADHVLDTPDRVVAPEYELQPSVPINVVSDGEEQPEGNVVPTNRNVRRRRVRQMAPNLLSPYVSQPQTKQSAIIIDLKQAVALVFLPVLIKNHWTLYVYDLANRRIQLLDSRPGRKKTMLSGVQQNLAKVVLWLAAHKKEVSPYDLRTFNFITPDVPLQPNEHDCRVFVMKFMELWSMRGFSKSIDVGRDLMSGTILRGCMHLVDQADSERVDKSKVNGDRLKEAQHINRSLSVLGDVISALAQKSPHVPYKNSKVTKLLQDSLEGQAKTLMFVHISPEPDADGETISIVKFAERFATVELGAARVNKDSADVKELKEQVLNALIIYHSSQFLFIILKTLNYYFRLVL
ncbi:hypothetical protein VitviT2T_002773 [Vitis vinifera]|uniref:Kinesin motor domain-containing protein n=1 Tax=Vitis vinifera TaxID=29760 RepID=A0ABY9BK82_VITVI|nr:hypothetical protein VitviT2T_002773 [Vitis vinifera]